MRLEKYCDEILKDESKFWLSELIQEIHFTGREDIDLLVKLVNSAYSIGCNDGQEHAKIMAKMR